MMTAYSAGAAATGSPATRAVSRGSRVPLYVQIADHMRERMRTGEWSAGTRIPNEAALSSMYGASRITVRSAVDLLSREGLLSPQPGRGTFVLDPVITTGVHLLTSFTQEMEAQGRRPSTRVLGQEVVEAPDDVALRLGVAAGAPVLRLERLRLADDEPVGHQVAWLSLRLCPGLESVDLQEISLYRVLDEQYGITATDAEEVFHAACLSPQDSSLLDAVPNSCGLAVERLALTNGEPFEYMRGVLRGDRYRVRMRLRDGGIERGGTPMSESMRGAVSGGNQ